MYEAIKAEFAPLLSGLVPASIRAKTASPEYEAFLSEVGSGLIGASSFMVYEWLTSLEDDWVISDESLRRELVLFGDDLSGSSFGFHPTYGQSVVRYDSSTGDVFVVDKTFLAFIRRQLSNLAKRGPRPGR